jgi:hypothetical protein
LRIISRSKMSAISCSTGAGIVAGRPPAAASAAFAAAASMTCSWG